MQKLQTKNNKKKILFRSFEEKFKIIDKFLVDKSLVLNVLVKTYVFLHLIQSVIVTFIVI